MQPSRFRDSQPLNPHLIHGVHGFLAHPPQVGIIDPPFILPVAFLSEITTVIREEISVQGSFINDRFSSVIRGYAEMNERFNESVRQTDRILAEQEARLEARLNFIQNEIRQFCDSQTAAVATLKEKLGSLEGLTETSRKTLDSKITTVTETMEHRFVELSTMVQNNQHSGQEPICFESGMPTYSGSLGDFMSVSGGPSFVGNMGYESQFDRSHGPNGALFPAVWSQTDSEAETTNEQNTLVAIQPALTLLSAPRTLPHCSSPGSKRFQEEPSTVLPPVVTLSVPVPPSASSGNNPECEEQDQLSPSSTADIDDVTDVSVSPQMTLPCDVSQDHPQDLPLQDLFTALSPLTQLSTSCSQDQEGSLTPTTSPEVTISEPCPLPSDAVSWKRKRMSSGLKKTRRNKKSRNQAEQDHVEESYADPPIWPPVFEDDTSQNYISCDRCAGWYHLGCVALRGNHEDGTPWDCPPCTKDPTRGVVQGLTGGERCFRPGCNLSKSDEYFMERLLGRCYEPNQGVMKYLVSYEGYGINDCTWEPAESFANDAGKIGEFLDWWATENPTVDVESLDPHDTIFIRDAYNYARIGMTWLGA